MDRIELPLEPRHLGPSGASKTFMSLCYVWLKPCTYLALGFTISPNGQNRAST